MSQRDRDAVSKTRLLEALRESDSATNWLTATRSYADAADPYREGFGCSRIVAPLSAKGIINGPGEPDVVAINSLSISTACHRVSGECCSSP